jgi:hypothetical protein
MTLAANKTAGRLFAAGMNTSGFLETAATLQEDDRERLTKIMADYMGSDNAGKMMILEGGMKWNGMTMKPIDAQLLATMGFNIEEIGRWLEMPPVLLGHNASGQTMWGTGVESIISSLVHAGAAREADSNRVFNSEAAAYAGRSPKVFRALQRRRPSSWRFGCTGGAVQRGRAKRLAYSKRNPEAARLAADAWWR